MVLKQATGLCAECRRKTTVDDSLDESHRAQGGENVQLVGWEETRATGESSPLIQHGTIPVPLDESFFGNPNTGGKNGDSSTEAAHTEHVDNVRRPYTELYGASGVFPLDPRLASTVW